MGKQEKLRDRLLSKPKDFTWQELNSLLTNLGFDLVNGKGSARKFYHPEKKVLIRLHEPHPDNIIKRYVIDDVITKLKEMGELNG